MTETPGSSNGPVEQTPNPPAAGDPALTFEEIEYQLHKRLYDSIFNLANFYNDNRQPRLAIPHLRQLLIMTNDPGIKAHFCVNIGQLMEQMSDFEGALEYYLKAFALEPGDPDDWYLIHNNLGYLYNMLERYHEGERYCRTAIQINPRRFNAYKNLGVALEGQERWLEAASNYILAVKANPNDPRALQHLENLLADHPDLVRENPSLSSELDDCRKANQPAGH